MPAPKTPERRHFVRVVFDAEAQLLTADGTLAAQLLDLSLKGALVELPKDHGLDAGEPCLLVVQLGEARIKMAGDIAHLKGRQAGVQCRSIDLESITHLRRLLEMNLGSAKLLERELQALVAA